ncbi:MAG: acyltransferase, partial [Firmicutes bacterium]|nr:acyltransferase [Bacillota bacterium]
RAPYDEFPDQNNKLIAKFVENDPEAYLIDWYSASNPHESWFDGDGTHMNAKGNKHYVKLIDEVLASVYGE